MRFVLHPDRGVARREERQGSTCMHSLTSPPIAAARLGSHAGRWRRTVAATQSVWEGRRGELRSAGRR